MYIIIQLICINQNILVQAAPRAPIIFLCKFQYVTFLCTDFTRVYTCNSTINDQQIQLMQWVISGLSTFTDMLICRENGRCVPYYGPTDSGKSISCDSMFTMGVDYVYITNNREYGNQFILRNFIKEFVNPALTLVLAGNQDCFDIVLKSALLPLFSLWMLITTYSPQLEKLVKILPLAKVCIS